MGHVEIWRADKTPEVLGDPAIDATVDSFLCSGCEQVLSASNLCVVVVKGDGRTAFRCYECDSHTASIAAAKS